MNLNSTSIFLLFISILFLSFEQKHDKTSNKWQRYELKGKVKSFELVSYKDGIQKNEPWHKVHFSIEGYEIKQEVFFFDSSKNFTIVNYYDKKQHLQKQIEYDHSGKKKNERTYKYGTNGKPATEMYYEDELVQKINYTYSDTADRAVIKNSSVSDTGTYLYVYRYDKSRNVTAVELSSVWNDMLISKTLYRYDKNGNKILDSLFGKKGVYQGKIVYKFNTEGKLAEKRYFNSIDSLSVISVYQYNKKGDEIDELSTNTSNNLKAERMTDYVYDEKGNWTIKKEYDIYSKLNVPVLVTERKITYY